MRGPEEIGRWPVALLLPFAIRSAIAAHVEHEHVEQRSIRNLAIDAPGLGLREAQRHIFMERAAGPCRKDQGVLLDVFLALVLGAGQQLARPPIVGHLVVVPLREDRHLGIEGEQVPVEQIVLVVGAELGQRLRRLGLFLQHDVLPDLAVGHLLFGQDRAVGVNIVAAVDEEVGPVAQHGRVGAHAAARFVDAPALPGGIARPHERDRALVARRGAKAARHRFADNGRRSKILEADAVEDVLPRGQAVDERVGGEIGFGQRIDEDGTVDGLETVGGRDLGQHARGAVGARPDHGGVERNVAGLNAVGDDGAIGGTAQIGPGDDGGDRGRRRGRGQKPPTRQGDANGHGNPPIARKRRRWRPILTARVRLYDNFVTVDNAHAPVGRVHGPSRAPFGNASCNISISPTVSEVTRPTSRPLPSTTATAGADFSCNMRNASSRQRR